MITVPELAAEALGSFLTAHLKLQIWIEACEPNRINSVGGPSSSGAHW